MKEVTIKSKIVGRGGASAATSPGKGVSVDMSGYLLKQIWEKVFEFRLTDDGTEYLFAKMDMAVQGGITMYANGGNLDLPSIYDGLPLDNDTIYWEETKDEEGNVIARILKSRGVGEGGVTPTLLGDLTNVGSWANAIATEDRIMVQKKDGSSWVALELSKIGGSASFENVKSDGGGNAFTSFVLSDDKKTLTFVKDKTFAEKSTTLSGYGITDAYTKTEADNLLAKKWAQDDAKIANWDTAFGWGDHSKVGYAKATDVTEELKKYVTLSGTQTITGEKNFTGGLKVNGKPLVYNSDGYWLLDGDLIVTGGVTMFANEGKYTPSTITDAVNIDNNTLVRVNGVIMLNPDIEFGGGVADSVAWSDVTGKPTWIGYSKPSYTTSEIAEGTNLYFTNARAVSALSDTLKGYLPLNGSAAMTGTLQSQTIRPKASDSYSLGTSSYLWSNVYTKLATIDGIEIKKSASGVLYIGGNLVVSGGITMYGTDGTSAPSIWDSAPIATTSVKGIASFDSNYFAVNNGKVTFIGEVGGGGIESITKQMVLDALGYTPYDANNPNGYVTSAGSVATATSLESYTAVQFTKSDNGGKPCYLLISDATSWYNAYNSPVGEYGIVGVMYGYRGGAMSGTCVQKMIAMCAHDKNFYELKTDVTSYVVPRIVKYNSKYYVALYMAGSNRSHYFIGKTSNMLSSFIELQCDANGHYSGLTVLYDTETMAMDGVSVPYAASAGSAGSCTGNAATATTASKLSTVSKSAWGKTYWTSGGVPTDINGDMSSVGNIISSANNSYELGSSANKWKSVHANCLSFGNEVKATLTTKGWYRFAVGGDENEYGGSFIFFIRRSCNNVKTESFVISATVGYGRVVFNQLSGAVSGSLITKVRATNYADNVIYFDLYYEGSTNGHVVYVNAVGDVTIQAPTSVSSAYSYTTEFTLGDGMVAGKALTCFDYKGLAFIRQKIGKNLLPNGDNLINTNAYAFGEYIYDESVVNGRTYRLTICGKLGDENTHIAAYWDGCSGNNTTITGLSSKEERVISITAKITNKAVLRFCQFPSNKFGSYIRWAYLEEAYKEGELSTTTDYNNWLAEYNKLDSRSFLYKIQRIDVGDSSYWSADAGMKIDNKLSVNGGIIVSDSFKVSNKSSYDLSSYLVQIKANSSAPGIGFASNSYSWYVQVYNDYMYVGRGTTNSFRIDPSGNCLSIGGITMYSDIRKKTILNHVELSLKEVADAPLIEHYYNSDESKRTHVGSIAQYWAGLNDWFCKEDGEGFLTMEIQNAALASAISIARELQRYESKTDKKIRLLKKRIGELEDEIEKLKMA